MDFQNQGTYDSFLYRMTSSLPRSHIPRNVSEFSQTPDDNSMSDCLAIAARSAQVLVNFDNAIPIPGPKSIGGVALFVFSSIQASTLSFNYYIRFNISSKQIRNNRDDYQDLVMSLSRLLDILHQELSNVSESNPRLDKFLLDVAEYFHSPQ